MSVDATGKNVVFNYCANGMESEIGYIMGTPVVGISYDSANRISNTIPAVYAVE
jgi:hypothetical protein